MHCIVHLMSRVLDMVERPKLRNVVAQSRKAHGLTQLELARRIGVTRQSVANIESGKFVASTIVALRMAEALDVRVEDLFALEGQGHSITAALAPGGESSESRRVVVGLVAGRWVAHRLDGDEGVRAVADGLTRETVRDGSTRVQVDPIRGETDARANLIVAGCDPALPVLAAWLGESARSVPLRCVHATSRGALDLLAGGLTHCAGTHLLDEASGEYNLPFVRRLFRRRGAIVVNLARWEEGFVVAPGNPLAIRTATDLTRKRVRVIQRERGAGARSVLERTLRQARIPERAVHAIPRVATGHLAVARAIVQGAADVGVATRSAASAFGLGFVPLAEERSDLVFRADLREDARLGRIVDVLRSPAFRRELGSLEGYGTAESGQVIAEVMGQ
jgi:molybdate-binding protein/DNA-binding XRE family transcriptional regulator